MFFYCSASMSAIQFLNKFITNDNILRVDFLFFLNNII